MSPRELIGFLVSCIRSGEQLSPQDDEVVAGVLAGLASAPEQQAKIEALADALDAVLLGAAPLSIPKEPFDRAMAALRLVGRP